MLITPRKIKKFYIKFIFSANIQNNELLEIFLSTNGRVQNQIGQFLAKRIVQAYTQNEDFRIYVVIPCVPGMNGRLEENTAAGQEVILHLTYESILRNDNSIRAYCRDNGVPGHDWDGF